MVTSVVVITLQILHPFSQEPTVVVILFVRCIFQQGKIGAISFIRSYIERNNLSKPHATEAEQQENGDPNSNNASTQPTSEDGATATGGNEPENGDDRTPGTESEAAAAATEPSQDKTEDTTGEWAKLLWSFGHYWRMPLLKSFCTYLSKCNRLRLMQIFAYTMEQLVTKIP